MTLIERAIVMVGNKDYNIEAAKLTDSLEECGFTHHADARRLIVE